MPDALVSVDSLSFPGFDCSFQQNSAAITVLFGPKWRRLAMTDTRSSDFVALELALEVLELAVRQYGTMVDRGCRQDEETKARFVGELTGLENSF